MDRLRAAHRLEKTEADLWRGDISRDISGDGEVDAILHRLRDRAASAGQT
jgi:hypothetical protein